MPPQGPQGNATGQITVSVPRETYIRLNTVRARLSEQLGRTVSFAQTIETLLDHAEAEEPA